MILCPTSIKIKLIISYTGSFLSRGKAVLRKQVTRFHVRFRVSQSSSSSKSKKGQRRRGRERVRAQGQANYAPCNSQRKLKSFFFDQTGRSAASGWAEHLTLNLGLTPEIHQLLFNQPAPGYFPSSASNTWLADSVTGVPGPKTPAAPAS